jgi:hypothetical protein
MVPHHIAAHLSGTAAGTIPPPKSISAGVPILRGVPVCVGKNKKAHFRTKYSFVLILSALPCWVHAVKHTFFRPSL